MSDSEEDLGFQLKTLKIASKTQAPSLSSLENEKRMDNGQQDLAMPFADHNFYAGDTHGTEREQEQENMEDEEYENKVNEMNLNNNIDEPCNDRNSQLPGENLSSTSVNVKFDLAGDQKGDANNDTDENENNLVLPEEADSDLDSDSDGEWQNMAAIASSNIYNEKGELEIRTYENEGPNTMSQEMLSKTVSSGVRSTSPDKRKMATFGYTKVAAEEQANRSYKANKKTDFLFDHKRMKRLNSSKNSLNEVADSVSQSETEKEFYDEYEEDVEPMNDLNADTQLNVTRDLLNDMEKFAYVGAVNVLSNQLCTDLATLCLCVDIVSHKKLARRLQFAQKDTARWKTEVLNRLYVHLGLSAEEITMIEKLSMHGIRLEDLCKCLQTTQSIDNPFETNEEENETLTQEDSANIGQKPNADQSEVCPQGYKLDDNQNSESRQATDDRIDAQVEQALSDYSAEEESDENIRTESLNNSDMNAVPNEVLQPENVKHQSRLEVDVAWTIICDLFLLLLQDATYDSRSRTLLIKFAELLNVKNVEICEFERRVTDSLDMEQSTEDQVWNESQHMKDRRKKRRRKKMCYVGLAMVGGSLVLGLSGGLLAPVIGAGIAAGLSTIGITGATGFLTGAGGATIVALTSTAIGGNIGARGMSKRMGSVRTFEFRPLHNNRRVNLIISVSGWMIGNEDDIRLPYSTVDPVEGDLYSLFWEPEMLKSIGQTINIVANEVFTQVIQQVLGATILTAFISAIQWPMGLSKLGYILDNPWSVSLDRAWASGLILADTLMTKNLGERPITLMGFSLGSRVIYSCLVELCKRNAHGLVENVFIFGTPVVRKREHLVMARSVVSGRFVNAYSLKDWMLAYLFRAAAGGFSKVMGITPIEGIEGIENFDCTETVDGHLAYRKNMPKLLKQLGVSVVSEEFVEIEETMDPEQVKRQRKLVHDVDAAQKKLLEKKTHSGWLPKWMKPKKSKWRSMVEDAVEEGKEIEESELTPSQPSKPKKMDNALVDHGALMHELQLIKAALREEQLHSGPEIEEASALTVSHSFEKEHTEPEISALEITATETTPKEVTSPKMVTPKSPNNFQLLTAGRAILPEDDVPQRGSKKMSFAFSDDF